MLITQLVRSGYNTYFYSLCTIFTASYQSVSSVTSHVRFFVTPWTTPFQLWTQVFQLVKIITYSLRGWGFHMLVESICSAVLCSILLKSQCIPTSVQLGQSCPTLCNPVDCSVPGFPVHHQLPTAAATKLFQLCPTLCNPTDSSPPGSSIPGILQARILEWVAISFSTPTPRVDRNSCPLSRWCHPTTSSSVVPFSSRLQSFPALGSFAVSQFFTTGGWSTGVSDRKSVV